MPASLHTPKVAHPCLQDLSFLMGPRERNDLVSALPWEWKRHPKARLLRECLWNPTQHSGAWLCACGAMSGARPVWRKSEPCPALHMLPDCSHLPFASLSHEQAPAHRQSGQAPRESSNPAVFHAGARDPCIHPPKGNTQAQGLYTEPNLHVRLTCQINPLLLFILRPGTSPSMRKERAAHQCVLREGSRDWHFPTSWQFRAAVLSHLLSHIRQKTGTFPYQGLC